MDEERNQVCLELLYKEIWGATRDLKRCTVYLLVARPKRHLPID